MDFSLSPRAADLRDRVRAFLDTEIEPLEADMNRRITRLRESGGDNWTPALVIKELQAKAREQGLWNLFLPAEHAGRTPRTSAPTAARASPTSTTPRSPR